MNEMDSFSIRSYGWQELAVCYSPDISAQAATKRLGRWVSIHPTLSAELKETGWQKGNRVLTPAQVRLIVDCLGEP